MKTQRCVYPAPGKVEYDFTGKQIMRHNGLSFRAKLSGLLKMLARQVKVKQRRRGDSDCENLLSVMATRTCR